MSEPVTNTGGEGGAEKAPPSVHREQFFEPLSLFRLDVNRNLKSGELKLVTGICELLEEGGRRAEGAPPARHISWRRLLTRLWSMPEENNQEDLTLKWPEWITNPSPNDLINEQDEIEELRIDDLFAAERHQLAIRGTKPGWTNEAEKKDAGPLPTKTTKKVDVERDFSGMGAAVEMGGQKASSKPLGFKDRIRQRVLELRNEEDARIETSTRKFRGILAADISVVQDNEPLSDSESLETLFEMDLPPSLVPSGEEGSLENIHEDERNSSYIDFLEDYPGLQEVRDALVLGTYPWIMKNADTGIRRERLRSEVVRGINTIFFGLLVDPEKLRRENDQKIILLSQTSELKALREAAQQLGKPRGYTHPSDESLRTVVTDTVKELEPHYIEDETARENGPYVLFSKHNRMLSLTKLRSFSAAWINNPGIRTTSVGFRNLARRGLQLTDEYEALGPAMLALERIARKRGSGPLLWDTSAWSEKCYQANTIGGVAAFYALALCFGSNQNKNKGQEYSDAA